MNLKAILKGCFEKKPNCQQLLYELYYNYAFRIAFRYLQHYDETAKLVNAAFVELFMNIDSRINKDECNSESALKNSIKKIIVDNASDKLIHSRSIPKIDRFYEKIQKASPHKPSQVGETYQALIFLLQSLAPWHRILFNMNVIDGFSYQQIADRFGISEDECVLNLSEAKTALQNLVKEKLAYLSIKQALTMQ